MFSGEASEEQEGDGDEVAQVSEPLREQDRFLPIANVARIMKKSIPTTGKVQSAIDTMLSFTVLVKIFKSYLGKKN